MAETFNDGIYLYKKRKYKDALAVFLSLSSDENINNIDLAYYVGLTYARLERYDEALLYLEQVVTGAQSSADTEGNTKRIYQCRMTLAVIYSKTDRPRLAEFELQKLTDSGYNTPEVNCALAYTAWIQDKKEESVQLYEKVLKENPNNTTALNGLGYVLACMDRELTRALSLCKKALETSPENPAFLDSMGWVYYKLGLIEDAKSYLKKARDKAPESPEIAEHFAAVSALDRDVKGL